MRTTREIEHYFAHLNLNDEQKLYLKYHSKRYALLLKIIETIRAQLPQRNIRIIDVGPSFFTEILGKHFPDDSILSLGFDSEESRGGHLPVGVHYNKDTFFSFDLNDAQYPNKWIKIPNCDTIIMAEVIEHLYTASTLVLKFVSSFLNKDGYLIIQTPNATSLIKRIRLLLGINPYELIQENRLIPGHFREYTKKELFSIAKKSDFNVVHFEYRNYFNRVYFIEKIYGFIQSFMPSSLRDGITLVLQKNG